VLYSGGEAQPSSSDRHCNASTGAGRSLKSFRKSREGKKYYIFLGEEKSFYFPSPPQLLRF
jgi:hypothetical protein